MAPLKYVLASGVTLALLVFLPGLVHAQSSVVWKTNYYAVGGATLREIHESFRLTRPWKNKSSYDGQTDWRISSPAPARRIPGVSQASPHGDSSRTRILTPPAPPVP